MLATITAFVELIERLMYLQPRKCDWDEAELRTAGSAPEAVEERDRSSKAQCIE